MSGHNLVKATYELLMALHACDVKPERNGKPNIVIYLDGADFHHAAWSLRQTAHRVGLTGDEIAKLREFTVNGILFRRRIHMPAVAE